MSLNSTVSGVQPEGADKHVAGQAQGANDPSVSSRDPADNGAAETPKASAELLARLSKLSRGNSLRIGVEFLPPAAHDTAVAVPPSGIRAESIGTLAATERYLPRRAEPRERQPYGGTVVDDDTHTWGLSSGDLAGLRSPVAEETLLFIDDLMGEDRRRLQRDLGFELKRLNWVTAWDIVPKEPAKKEADEKSDEDY